MAFAEEFCCEEELRSMVVRTLQRKDLFVPNEGTELEYSGF